MSKNIAEIPFTEITERTKEIVRGPDKTNSRIRGAIQDEYVRNIPAKEDWKFLYSATSIITDAQYNTGTASVNTGATTVTFSSDVSLTSAYTGRKIKLDGNDVIYAVTYSNATAITINPSFQGTTNASNAGYIIFQDTYSLPESFDRFPKNGGVYKWQGGQKKVLEEKYFQQATDLQQATPSVPEWIRLFGQDTLGRQQIVMIPPPKDSRVYGMEYITKLKPLYETSAGTVTISAGGTTVTGATTCRFNEATSGDYLRVNALGVGQESQWYRISTISNDSSLTLAVAFANTSVTSVDYIISKSPEIPARMQPAIIYGAGLQMTVDQNDPNFAYYLRRYAEVMSDNKLLYAQRIYNQDFEHIGEEYRYRR